MSMKNSNDTIWDRTSDLLVTFIGPYFEPEELIPHPHLPTSGVSIHCVTKTFAADVDTT
jgi:hypothetical protein